MSQRVSLKEKTHRFYLDNNWVITITLDYLENLEPGNNADLTVIGKYFPTGEDTEYESRITDLNVILEFILCDNTRNKVNTNQNVFRSDFKTINILYNRMVKLFEGVNHKKFERQVESINFLEKLLTQMEEDMLGGWEVAKQ